MTLSRSQNGQPFPFCSLVRTLWFIQLLVHWYHVPLIILLLLMYDVLRSGNPLGSLTTDTVNAAWTVGNAEVCHNVLLKRISVTTDPTLTLTLTRSC